MLYVNCDFYKTIRCCGLQVLGLSLRYPGVPGNEQRRFVHSCGLFAAMHGDKAYGRRALVSAGYDHVHEMRVKDHPNVVFVSTHPQHWHTSFSGVQTHGLATHHYVPGLVPKQKELNSDARKFCLKGFEHWCQEDQLGASMHWGAGWA